MKIAQIPVLIALSCALCLSGFSEASGQYYIKKKKEQAEEVVAPPADEALPAPESVEDPEAYTETYTETPSAPCTKKEIKDFEYLQKGFDAVEKDPGGETEEAEDMYNFLEKPGNIGYMIDLFARCKPSPSAAAP